MRIRAVFPFALPILAAVAVSAQSLPTDNPQWSARCASLIQSGGVPAPDASGIAPARFEELARERSTNGQHFVACNLFLAAAAGQAASGNSQQSQDDISMAKLEQKLGLKQKLSFVDKLNRTAEVLDETSKQNAPASQQEMYALSMMASPAAAPPGYAPPPSPGYAPQYGAPAAPGPYPPPPANAPGQPQYSAPQDPYQAAAPPAGQQPGYPAPAPAPSYAAPAPQPAYAPPAAAAPQLPPTIVQDDAGAPPSARTDASGPLSRQIVEQVIHDSLYPDSHNSDTTVTSLDFHSVQIAKPRLAHLDLGIPDGTQFYPVLVKFTSTTRIQMGPSAQPMYTAHDIAQVYNFFRDDFGNWVLKIVGSSENRDVQSQHN